MRISMVRKTVIAVFAALASLFIFAAPVMATPAQPWEPSPEAPNSGVYVEPGVDEETRNAVQSAYEATLEGTTSTRYTYVSKLPETWDIQTAARTVAEVWELDRLKDSILFYDAQGKKAFIWPATTANTAALEALRSPVTTEALTESFASLYETAPAAAGETEDTSEAADAASDQAEEGDAGEEDEFPVWLLFVIGFFVFIIFIMWL
jgi:hypothetical protein